MKTKTCYKCETEKPLSEFYRDKAQPDGYLSQCKACKKAYEYQRRQRKTPVDTVAYKTVSTGHTAIDYDHPKTRTFIRKLLHKLSDEGRMPHRSTWEQERPEYLPASLWRIQQALGFCAIDDMADWAGLYPANYSHLHWPRIIRAMTDHVDDLRQKIRQAEHEYSYGLTVCDTPRTVRSYKPRRGAYVEVEAYLVR